MGKRSKRQQSGSSEKLLDTSSPASTRGPQAMPALDMVLLVLAGIGMSLNQLSDLRRLV